MSLQEFKEPSVVEMMGGNGHRTGLHSTEPGQRVGTRHLARGCAGSIVVVCHYRFRRNAPSNL